MEHQRKCIRSVFNGCCCREGGGLSSASWQNPITLYPMSPLLGPADLCSYTPLYRSLLIKLAAGISQARRFFALYFLHIAIVFPLYLLCTSLIFPLYFLYSSFVHPLYFLCISFVIPLYFLYIPDSRPDLLFAISQRAPRPEMLDHLH